MRLTDADLQSGRLNDNLVLEVYNFSTIGKPKSMYVNPTNTRNCNDLGNFAAESCELANQQNPLL